VKRLKFAELGLSNDMLRAVTEMGFEEASPIQSGAIPIMMQGRDVIGQAQTGTGKTAAFAIPIIEKLDMLSQDIQAIIMCPTRELVIQVADEFRKLLRFKINIHASPIYGGQEIERQFRALKKNPQIIIGTPGRTLDHIRRGSINLSSVKFVVLDEADEMLDMGFRDEIETILEKTPDKRQTVMFSATMPEDIRKLMRLYQNNPEIIDVTNQKINAPKIEQIYYEIQENSKAEALTRLIDFHNLKLALVFCNNDLPNDEEDYVHRIGRTGRAGKTGIAFSFVVGKQIYYLKRIEKANDMKMSLGKIPSIDDLDETRINKIKEKIEGVIAGGHLTKYMNMIYKIMEGDYVALDIAAAMLKMALDEKNENYDTSKNFESEKHYSDYGSRDRDNKKSVHNRKNFKNRTAPPSKRDEGNSNRKDNRFDRESFEMRTKRKKSRR